MRAIDEPATQWDRRTYDSIDVQEVDAAHRPHHVDQGIQSAQLVQVDVLCVRCGVNARFDLADAPQDRH